MKQNNVQVAFELLLQEITAVVEAVRRQGALFLEQGQLDEAQRAIEVARQCEAFRARVKEMQFQWSELFAQSLPTPSPRPRPATGKRLPRGLRTPEEAFRRPILEALVELGGAGRVEHVLQLVEQKMGAVLTDYDRSPLRSNGSIRWKNTAQWCRKMMVQEGLLESSSPRGIWKLTEMGWAAVNERSRAESAP